MECQRKQDNVEFLTFFASFYFNKYYCIFRFDILSLLLIWFLLLYTLHGCCGGWSHSTTGIHTSLSVFSPFNKTSWCSPYSTSTTVYSLRSCRFQPSGKSKWRSLSTPVGLSSGTKIGIHHGKGYSIFMYRIIVNSINHGPI